MATEEKPQENPGSAPDLPPGSTKTPAKSKTRTKRTAVYKGRRALRLDAPAVALKMLQDAINDVRSAKNRTELSAATQKCKAISFACSVWFGGYEKHVLQDQFLRQQQQLEQLQARISGAQKPPLTH